MSQHAYGKSSSPTSSRNLHPVEYFAGVVGQEAAVKQLEGCLERPVHAYLFVGPSGGGKRAAAMAFAAALMQDERALHGVHPDVQVVEREGASINVAQAREISRIAARSPLEGDRKVLILEDFHLVDEAAPALLKTIEEASETTTFIVLAESISPELVTVASRCVVIEFRAIAESVIVDDLVASGVDGERAAAIAAASFGDLDRARLLAQDDTVMTRHQLWIDVPTRLDGTGAAAATAALEVVASIDAASDALTQRQAAEVAVAKERIERKTSASGALKTLETQHKRELRRLRMDELRSGFATVAQEMSRRLQFAPTSVDVVRVEAALRSLHWANEALAFNPNESLLLQGLFVRLSEDLSAG
jgi:DNA polymerase-3 subunit delta'